jgi:adenylyltransferase/sulfurtransferase
VNARVLIAGAGGLGCPASLALAKAGVSRLTVVDPDTVDLSNLHRQLWYRTADVGQLKAPLVAERLQAAFPDLEVVGRTVEISAANAEALFREHDLVIDGTDGVATKFLLSDTAVLTGTPLVYGGVLRLSGQAMVIRRGGPCLRCLFESVPSGDDVPTCAQAGVLGPMAGVIGGLQALLALGCLAPGGQAGGGAGAGDAATLHLFDGATLSARTVTVRRSPDCVARHEVAA